MGSISDWSLSSETMLDIVAHKEGKDPIIKEMTYGQWMKFKVPNNGWHYTAYQKGFHQFSYETKKE